MKKTTKRIFGLAGFALAAVMLTGCTKSFCSVQDKAQNLALYEDENIAKINQKAEAQGWMIAQPLFLKFIDLKVESYIETHADDPAAFNAIEGGSFKTEEERVAYEKQYRYNVGKFAGLNEKGQNELWYNYDSWYDEFLALPSPTDYKVGDEKDMTEITFGGPAYAPSASYLNFYKNSLNSGISANIACLTPESGVYGSAGNQAYIEGKTWSQAFKEYGPIEGLLVYPVGCLLHYFTKFFGTTGIGQVISIFLVTLIVRFLIIIATFSSTVSQSRMSELQPKIMALQQKYPDADKNPQQKQQLAQEQMLLYKKNKIHPFRQILVMIIQFPVFIAVWGAMQGSAILTQGTVFGLELITKTSDAILSWGPQTPFAIILILLMSIAQFISTKIPQWFQSWKADRFVERTVKNDAMAKQNKTAKIVSTVMLLVIIFMGFTLPAAMGIYWFFGAIISIIQSVAMEAYQSHSRHKKGRGGRKGGSTVGKPKSNVIYRRGEKQ